MEHPYQSARAHVLTEKRFPVASKHADISREKSDNRYSTARQHGLSLGYNTFTTVPPPPADASNGAGKEARWLVDATTLTTTSSAPTGQNESDELRAAREAAQAALLLHDPSARFADRATALRAKLADLQLLTGECVRASVSVQRRHAALTVSGASASGVGCSSSFESAYARLDNAREAGNAARELSAKHWILSDEVGRAAHELDGAWRAAQSEGEAARKGALLRMAELANALQAEMEEAQLRLTDHVLMGTKEEAERMERTPGPDGDRLRELKRRQAQLEQRQRQQKAVLVGVARKAVAATTAQDGRMTTGLAELAAASQTRSQLEDETDRLEQTLREATGNKNPLNAPLAVGTSRRASDLAGPSGAVSVTTAGTAAASEGASVPMVTKTDDAPRDDVRAPRVVPDVDHSAPRSGGSKRVGAVFAAVAQKSDGHGEPVMDEPVPAVDEPVLAASAPEAARNDEPSTAVPDAPGISEPSPDLSAPILVRWPDSGTGLGNWAVHRKLVKVRGGSLGLSLARDDSLPTLLLGKRLVSLLEDPQTLSDDVGTCTMMLPGHTLKRGEQSISLGSGLLIAASSPSGVAAAHDLRVGDVLVSVNGTKVEGTVPAPLAALASASSKDEHMLQFVIARPTRDALASQTKLCGFCSAGS